MLRRKKIGQSTAEYAIVIGLVIAAAVAMQVYVKRGIQGKIRDASLTPITVENVTGNVLMYGMDTVANQYEPNFSDGTALTSTRTATESTVVSTGGGVTRGITGNDVSSRTGNQVVVAP